MKGEPAVIDHLNEALRHELTAVNQYWLHYRLLKNWGVHDLAEKWRAESIEEMRHADQLIERILFLEGFPNMQTLDALGIGKTVQEIMERDLQAELLARALYAKAAAACHAAQDFATRGLFETLIQDEEAHIDFLETELALIGKIGVELYTQRRLGKLDET
jgi:bacterioferritin|uniref:Bacterioferritin n=1 Tax=Acidicaldus sp. TaxID=1872105 RepID=A0A8J4H8A1_9PROT